MTKFAELHAQFVEWDTALTQYEQKATMVMLGFYSGFYQYLGLDPASDGDVITLHKIDPTATGLSKHVAVDNFSKALSQDDDGTWRFGLTIKMRDGVLFDHVVNPDKDKESHTADFNFDMRFTLRDDECNFQNAQDHTKSFPINSSNRLCTARLMPISIWQEYSKPYSALSPVIRQYTNPSDLIT